ncbi:MAG: hypothetical protein NWQ46_04925 [Spirosomaceae bacterium]|nr:hypothetical protein [Spirosomataceae bacterium]
MNLKSLVTFIGLAIIIGVGIAAVSDSFTSHRQALIAGIITFFTMIIVLVNILSGRKEKSETQP